MEILLVVLAVPFIIWLGCMVSGWHTDQVNKQMSKWYATLSDEDQQKVSRAFAKVYPTEDKS